MSQSLTQLLLAYLPLIVFIGVAAVIGLALLVVAFLVAYKQPDPESRVNSELADKGFLAAAAADLIAWACTGSLMWMTFALACCAIEMMQRSMPRYDAERFGFAPRRCAPAAATISRRTNNEPTYTKPPTCF